MSVTSQATVIDSRAADARPTHRRGHARRPKAWIGECRGVFFDGQADDVMAWASARRPIALSAAELGVPLDPTPWSFWLVLRLGEAMLAAGVIGLGWGAWQAVATLGSRLAMAAGL